MGGLGVGWGKKQSRQCRQGRREIAKVPDAAHVDFVFFTLRGLCTVSRSEAGLTSEGSPGVAHHSHWLEQGQPSTTVAYYDAASLYPSSGKLRRGLWRESFFRPGLRPFFGGAKKRRGENPPFFSRFLASPKKCFFWRSQKKWTFFCKV